MFNKNFQLVSLRALPVTMLLFASLTAHAAVVTENLAPAIATSAAAASPSALVSLAVQYEHGEGVPRDYLRAASLYCSAARDGDANALYGLGWMYANGRGMPIDDQFASRLFKLASDAGHVHARALIDRLPAASNVALPPCLIVQTEPVDAETKPEQEDDNTGRDLRNISGAKIYALVTRLAPRYQIDPNLAMAIIYIESGFNVKARSPMNAQGLMQLMPDTAQRFNVKNTFDAEDNIKGGLQYLRWLLAHFEGNVALVAAAYNAGEGAVARHNGVPPYAETRAYVAKLATIYRRAIHPFDSRIAATSAILKTGRIHATTSIKMAR